MAPGVTDATEKQETDTTVPTKTPKGIVLGPDGKPYVRNPSNTREEQGACFYYYTTALNIVLILVTTTDVVLATM